MRTIQLPVLLLFLAFSAMETFAQTDAKKPDTKAEKKQAANKTEASKTADAPESPNKPEEENVAAGHSYHGEAFNEGARQAAYLMDGMGKVRFPVTAADKQAEQFVAQGVSQLHGFWYLESERSFRQAAAIDPECAMAYWGMAMANKNNAKRAKAFMEEAVKRKDKVSEREKMYIEALDAYHKAAAGKTKDRGEKYIRALEKIVYKYPDDIEAKAFIALQMWMNRRSQSPIGSYLAVNALIEQVLAEEPLHPCHHYRIHLWDYENAEMAVPSAIKCGQASPGIAHMWHMPGHIFSKLKRYNDAAWQQEASARVDHAHMIRDQILPDQIHNFAHNNEWLIRNLSNTARVHDAIDLAMNMTELPRHPKHNSLGKRGSAYYGRTRLFEVLSRYEMWDRLIALSETPYLERTANEKEQVKRLRFLGRACYRSDRVERARDQLAILENRLNKLTTERDKKVAEAEKKAKDAKKSDKDTKKAKSDAERPFKARVILIEKAIHELKGHEELIEENFDEALALFKKAGSMETEFITSVKVMAGKTDEAIEDARKYVDSHKNEVRPMTSLVETLFAASKKDECKKQFAKLAEVAHASDLDIPAISRLEPIAAKLGLEQDWRAKVKTPADVGDRPDLDSLGPFRWHPTPASDWTLTDSNGEKLSLSAYEGKPVVVIFYLGYGCLHCAEQLKAFAPMTAKFEKAGISMMAISTDKQDELIESRKNYNDKGKFPFPLVSDEKLEVFRKWRVFDDFEDIPLHGTFLIDGNGLVRWHDISYEPFNDPKFVLNEAKRLLAQDSPTSVLAETKDKPTTPQADKVSE